MAKIKAESLRRQMASLSEAKQQAMIQEITLSREQTLLNNMFGGNVGKSVLLDRQGQFFDGSGFNFARSRDKSTSRMFGARGSPDAASLFIPKKRNRRRTI